MCKTRPPQLSNPIGFELVHIMICVFYLTFNCLLATMASISMGNFPIAIDISNNEDLLRLAEEVKKSNTPRELKKKDETVAVLVPAGEAGSVGKKLNEADYNAMLATLGSWKDLDTDTMVKNIYRARALGSRPLTRP